MFCHHCGQQIDEETVFCPHCGTKIKAAPTAENETQKAAPTQPAEKDEFFRDVPPPAAPQPVNNDDFFKNAPPPPAYQQQQAPQSRTNTLAIVGFVLSFFFALAGLICSIMGLKQCNQTKEGGKGLAIAGIVISAVSIGISFILGIVWGSALFSLFLWD